MRPALKEASRRAKTYYSFAEFAWAVRDAFEMKYGWVDGRLYQLWPGGRCIDWTVLARSM